MIRGQRKVSVDRHQLEIIGVGSDARRGMYGPLRGNHLCLRLNLAFRRYLEKLARPVLVAEFDAFLVVLVIWTGAGAAQPLLVDIPQLFFQRGAVFTLAGRRFFGWFLAWRERRNR